MNVCRWEFFIHVHKFGSYSLGHLNSVMYVSLIQIKFGILNRNPSELRNSIKKEWSKPIVDWYFVLNSFQFNNLFYSIHPTCKTFIIEQRYTKYLNEWIYLRTLKSNNDRLQENSMNARYSYSKGKFFELKHSVQTQLNTNNNDMQMNIS